MSKKYSGKTKRKLTDSHHLLWQRRHWKGGHIKELRNHWYCIVDIDKNSLHRHIHGEINTIPVPRDISAEIVLQDINTLANFGVISPNDNIEQRLKVLIALFDYIEKPTADALRKQLKIVRTDKKSP